MYTCTPFSQSLWIDNVPSENKRKKDEYKQIKLSNLQWSHANVFLCICNLSARSGGDGGALRDAW